MAGQKIGEAFDDGEVLIVDGTLAAEVMVMLCDHLEALARHAPATSDVFEKRHDIGGLVWTAETDEENCIGHTLDYSDSPMRIIGLFLTIHALAFSQSVEDKYREVSQKIIAQALKDEGGMAKLAYLCDRIGN